MAQLLRLIIGYKGRMAEVRAQCKYNSIPGLMFLAIAAQGCATFSPLVSHDDRVPGAQKLSPEQPVVVIQRGEASWYGPGFQGKKMASGDSFDEAKLIAAHKTFPLGSKARVTNLKNGNSVEVEITDRGPYTKGRIIDLSKAAAEKLGIVGAGTAPVQVELLSESAWFR